MNESGTHPVPAPEPHPAGYPQPPVWLGLAWGFAESTLFFVVPDIVITLAALSSLRQAVRQLGAVLAGSLAGGLLMYALATSHGESMRHAVASVPFVTPAMFAKVESDLVDHGAWAMCMGPLSGIPYKVYAVLAPAHVAPVPFVLVSVPARLERLAASMALFAIVGILVRRFLPGRTRTVLGCFVLYWVVVYGFYWGLF